MRAADLAKNEVAYQPVFDLNIHMPYNGFGYLKGGATASPTLAGKPVYLWGNQGTCIAIEPGRMFKQVARNRLESCNLTCFRIVPCRPARIRAGRRPHALAGH
ncbi:MAG: hypothetical protein ACE15C_01915 [Phycisphaerae bacterium]